jgi:tripartite-type tricarboxylate transporter receptor subunit TctC
MRHCLSLTAAAAVVAVAAAAPGSAQADTGKDFYNGKTVRWIIATGTGGGHDHYARLFSRHMQKALPGSTFVTLNKPGAGHRIGANLIYVAKPDGLTIGNFTTGLIYVQIQNLQGVKFDLAKMSWIGKGGSDIRVVSVAHNSEYPTWESMLNSKREVKFNASGVGSGAFNDSFLIAEAFKFPYRILLGYQGPETALSMLRRETDALVGGMSSGMNYVRAGQTKMILRFGDTAQFAELMKVIPDAVALAKTPEQKRLAQMLTNYGKLSRIIAGPPDIVPDRLKAMRTAFMEAARSPAMVKEAKAMHREIEAADGEETTRMVLDMLNQPPQIIAMLTALSKAEAPMIKSSGKVTAIKNEGRAITIGFKGEQVTAKVSGSRTKIMVDGKKVKRKAVKLGMVCTFTWPKVNSEAQNIDCKK